MTQWREYETKAELSELAPIEQAEAIGAIVTRWLKRYGRNRRKWMVSEVYPMVYVLGHNPASEQLGAL